MLLHATLAFLGLTLWMHVEVVLGKFLFAASTQSLTVPFLDPSFRRLSFLFGVLLATPGAFGQVLGSFISMALFAYAILTQLFLLVVVEESPERIHVIRATDCLLFCRCCAFDALSVDGSWSGALVTAVAKQMTPCEYFAAVVTIPGIWVVSDASWPRPGGFGGRVLRWIVPLMHRR